METAGYIIQLSIYGIAGGFVLLAFPFMLLSFRQRSPAPAPAPPRIRALLPARTETADFEVIDDNN